MSYCKSFGKDKVIFATKEDHSVASKIELPETEPPPGLILPNGDINWNCPCLGGMATGPCGVEFREAFSCFHFSEENQKGSDCYKSFSSMQECFGRYPTVYNKSDNDDNDDDDNDNDKINTDTTSGEMAAMIQSGDALKSDDNSKNNSNNNNRNNNNSDVDSAEQINESKVQSTAKTAIKTK